jgi:hypothetical protein
MKKVLLTAAAVMTFGLMSAQEENTSAYKPVKGTIATEVGLTGGLNNADFNLNTGAVKFRYFFKDDMALRLGLGINSNKYEDIDNSNPSNVVTETYKNSNTTLKLGIEKHFAGAERLSTYAGADLLIGFRGASYEYTDNTVTTEVDGSNTIGNTAGSNFGLGLFTGADYYITKKVFLGVEAGFNFMTGKNKDITTTSTGSPSVTTSGDKMGSFTTNVVGGVRIGFQF